MNSFVAEGAKWSTWIASCKTRTLFARREAMYMSTKTTMRTMSN